MRRLLTTTAILAAVGAGPAHATLQIAADVNGGTFFCADNTACDTDPTIGTLSVTTATINGVTVTGSVSISQSGGIDELSTSSLQVINNDTTAHNVTVAVGDTGFAGPVSLFSNSGSGTWLNAPGDTATYTWFGDPANTQGAGTAFSTPGSLLDSFTNTAAGVTSSFSHDFAGTFSAAGPFSLTEQAAFNLDPGGQLNNRGQTVVLSVPEPQTWAMMLTGFTGLGLLGFKRRKNRLEAFA